MQYNGGMLRDKEVRSILEVRIMFMNLAATLAIDNADEMCIRDSSLVISFPAVPFAMLRFWQNTQCRAQPEKNTAPEPLSPERQGSSQ